MKLLWISLLSFSLAGMKKLNETPDKNNRTLVQSQQKSVFIPIKEEQGLKQINQEDSMQDPEDHVKNDLFVENQNESSRPLQEKNIDIELMQDISDNGFNHKTVPRKIVTQEAFGIPVKDEKKDTTLDFGQNTQILSPEEQLKRFQNISEAYFNRHYKIFNIKDPKAYFVGVLKARYNFIYEKTPEFIQAMLSLENKFNRKKDFQGKDKDQNEVNNQIEAYHDFLKNRQNRSGLLVVFKHIEKDLNNVRKDLNDGTKTNDFFDDFFKAAHQYGEEEFKSCEKADMKRIFNENAEHRKQALNQALEICIANKNTFIEIKNLYEGNEKKYRIRQYAESVAYGCVDSVEGVVGFLQSSLPKAVWRSLIFFFIFEQLTKVMGPSQQLADAKTALTGGRVLEEQEQQFMIVLNYIMHNETAKAMMQKALGV